MAQIGNIILGTGVNTSGMQRGIRQLNQQFSSLKTSLGSIGAAVGLAFGVNALVDFTKSAVETASALAEVQNVVNVTFGDAQKSIEEFSKSAINDFGMATLTAKKYSSEFGAAIKAMGFDINDVAEYSTTLTGLSADMASFFNIQSAQGKQDLFSALIAGQTEPMSKYGIVMNVAALQTYALSKGITKAFSEMSTAEKFLLRYNFVLEKTSDVHGDFIRTQESWSNQVRLAEEQWKQLGSTLGNIVINTILPALQSVNKLLERLNVLTAKYREVASGEPTTSTQNQSTELATLSDNLSDTTDGYDDLAAATKKANKSQQLSFDTLNKLSTKAKENTANNKSTIEATKIKKEDTKGKETTSTQNEFIKQQIDFINSINLEPLYKSLASLRGAFSVLQVELGKGFKYIYESVLKPLSKWTIEKFTPRLLELLAAGLMIVTPLLEAFGMAFEDIFVKNGLGAAIGDAFLSFMDWLIIKMQDLGKWMSDNKETVEALIITFGVFFALFTGISAIVSFIGIITSIITTVTTLYGAITGIITTIAGFGATLAGVGATLSAFGATLSGIFTAVIGFISWPVVLVVAIVAALAAISYAVYKNWDTIKAAFKSFIDWIKTSWTNFTKWISDSVGAIGKAIGSIWIDIKTGFDGIINGMIGGVEKFINFFINGINSLIGMINKIQIKLPDFMGGGTVGLSVPTLNNVNLPRVGQPTIAPDSTNQKYATNGKQTTVVQSVLNLDGQTVYKSNKVASNQYGLNLVTGGR